VAGCGLHSDLFSLFCHVSSHPMDQLETTARVVGDMLQEMNGVSLCTMHVKKADHALASTERSSRRIRRRRRGQSLRARTL
jgi:hypothetical protein